MMKQQGNSGIYIHLPFCMRKCSYCSFYSELEGGRESAYLSALQNEIEFRAKAWAGYAFDSIYIGGGTPSCLRTPAVAAILNSVRTHYQILKNCEITVEANPETFTEQLAEAWAKAGVNRLSMGLQAIQPELLAMLGRNHSAEQYLNAVQVARGQGIQNINADLIYGLPNQTVEQWQQSLTFAVQSGICHLSCYALSIDAGTPLEAATQSGSIPLPDEDLEADMRDLANDYLPQQNLQRYEISNYAKVGFESRHNLKYWYNLSYLGLGAGAHGSRVEHPNPHRYYNKPDIDAYIQALQNGQLPPGNGENNPDSEQMFECIMLSTRLIEGLNIPRFNARFNVSFRDMYKRIIMALTSNDLAIVDETSFKLTPRGLDIQNSILRLFLEAKV